LELSPETLKKIKRIELKAGHLVNDAFSGGYLSSFKGQGMEWEDVRMYVPGDDVRRIDWKVTAKTGDTQIKQFREEREMVVYLLVDVSGSGLFGSKDALRSDRIAELAAAIAFCTTRNNDKIGVLFFSDKVQKHTPPGSGLAHIFRVIREILAFEAGASQTATGRADSFGTHIMPVVERLCHLRKKRTVVFVISDFWMPDIEAGLRQLSVRHSVQLLWLRDALEKKLPAGGLLPVEDSETKQRMWIDLSSSAKRNAYFEVMGQHAAELSQMARKHRCKMVELSNDEGCMDQLVKHFKS
jgi:uncharacterized protein (DUF58 family)